MPIRTTLIVALFLLFVGMSRGYAASSLTLHASQLSGGTSSAKFETDVGKMFGGATTIGVQTTHRLPKLNGFDELTVSGISVGLRYYLDGRAHQGFYVGGIGSVAFADGKFQGTKTSARIVTASTVAGYKWLLTGGFFLDLVADGNFPVDVTVMRGKGKVRQEDFAGAVVGGISLGVGISF